jgi:integrase
MRGSLRLHHAKRCPASARGQMLRSDLCSCRPTVQARVARVERRLGYLELGWRVADLAEFERRLAELREKVVHGQVLPPSRPVTVEEFAGPWFERIAAQVELGRMSPLTYNKYEGDWRRHLRPAFGSLPLGAIDQPLLLQYLRTKIAEGLTEGTAKASLTVLSGMLTDAVSQGHIANNPLRSPTRARHRGGSRHDVLDLNVRRKPAKYLEVSEALALLDATPEPYVAMVLLALTSGLRRNELLGLQWEWLDFGSGRLDLRGQLYWRRAGEGGKREASIVRCKYDSERELPLYSGVAQLLGPHRQATGFVFTHPTSGGPWNETLPSTLFLGPAYERCGLRRQGRMWHQLRHTYASVLAAGGIRRHEVEQLMGHKAQGTTGLYTHLFRESYEKVEAVLDDVYGPWVRPRVRQQRRAKRTQEQLEAEQASAFRRF